MRLSRKLYTLAGGFLVLACGSTERSGGAGDLGGTLVIAAPVDPGMLAPPAVDETPEKQVVDQVFDGLAEIGPDLNTIGDVGWGPRLADSWTWSPDSMSIVFHLNPRARWHDGAPVRASDVRFSLGMYKDPAVKSATAGSLSNVDSVSAPDSLTAVVWFKQRSPEQFFQVAYNLTVVPEHLLRDVDRSNLEASEFARNPVGSGPFRFVSWTPRQTVQVEANTSYHLGRPKLDRVIWTWNPDADVAATKVLAGEADFVELLSPSAMARVASNPSVRAVPYRLLNYAYLAFNLRDSKQSSRPHPVFGDRATRLALSMALDRRAMLKNVFDSLAVVSLGPFSRGYATADTALPQVPYDTAGATRMLDSLGWRDTNGDGTRERAGVQLRFALLAPSSSTIRQQYAVLLQEQLRRVGARVDIRSVDRSVMGPSVMSGQFDAFIQSITVDPSPSGLEQSWRSPRGSQRGYNYSSYSNPRVDALMDSAVTAFDPARSRALYHRAYETIVSDAPAIWLYESQPRAGVHSRIRYVVDRAEFWWRDIRHWWIPASERIDRDRIGLAATTKSKQ